jgi:hypothetical protein
LRKISLFEDIEEANERLDDDPEPPDASAASGVSSLGSSLKTGGGGSSCLGGALGGEPMRDADACRTMTRGEMAADTDIGELETDGLWE